MPEPTPAALTEATKVAEDALFAYNTAAGLHFVVHGGDGYEGIARTVLTAAWPTTAVSEHPVRCPARLSVFLGPALPDGSRHTCECIHPAKVPDGVVGVLEHRCECGCTWSECNPEGGAL